MSGSRGGLLEAIRRLEQALADDGAGRLGRSLAGVEAALRRHTLGAHDPDGTPGPVDRTRLGLARRSARLGRRHLDLLRETVALREAAARTATAQDRRALCRRAARLAAQLRKAEEEEAGLVLESVNTELGAGD